MRSLHNAPLKALLGVGRILLQKTRGGRRLLPVALGFFLFSGGNGWCDQPCCGRRWPSDLLFPGTDGWCDSSEPLQTVSPEVLLKAMPEVPPEWVCIRSGGSATLSGSECPITSVTRRYVLPPPAAEAAPSSSRSAEPEEAPRPPEVRIIAADFGSREIASRSPEAEASTGEESPEILRHGGLVGRVRALPGRFLFEARGEKRLFIQIEGRNMKRAEFDTVVRRLPMEALLAAEKEFPTTSLVPETEHIMENFEEVPVRVYRFTNIWVDELKPSSSRTWESTSLNR